MELVRDHRRGWVRIRRPTLEMILGVTAAVVVIVLVRPFAIQALTVSSVSMMPTLLPRDSVLVNTFIYRVHPPRRGDLIVFRFPQADGREFVKRVVGLPGDVVKVDAGRVYVNGATLVRGNGTGSGDHTLPAIPEAPERIPSGQFFVMGDNWEESLDSRLWGTVDQHNVIGKAFLIYWSRGVRWWDVRWDRIGRWLP